MTESAVQDPETEQGSEPTKTAEPDPQGPQLPAPVLRRGITESQWLVLFNLYPGARPESALMVWDYCKTRGLDPMKKPCHIVQMRVKNARSGEWEWRDVVMPGIYEYRITAHRTGLYNGHSEPTYGEDVQYAGVTAPAWCALTALRLNPKTQKDMPFPVKVYFREVVSTTKEGKANDRWNRAPIQMLTKCAEAAALREAFPEEFGGEGTDDERAGKDDEPAVTIESAPIAEPVRRSEKATAAAAPSTAEPPAEPTLAAVADAEPEPAAAKPGPAATPQVTKGLRITDTKFIPGKEGRPPAYEIHANKGEAGKVGIDQVFVTRDEQLYKLAVSCEESDARFDLLWHEAKAETTKKVVRVLTGLTAAD